MHTYFIACNFSFPDRKTVLSRGSTTEGTVMLADRPRKGSVNRGPLGTVPQDRLSDGKSTWIPA